MKREENIFYNLVKNEKSLTEVFCNLLHYKIVRDLFISIINKKREALHLEQIPSVHIKYDSFSTEKDFGEDDNCFDDTNNKIGRGDLILKDNDDSEYIFELKIERYTQLTKNQPEGYLCYLDEDNSKLFFIVPRGYLHINDIYNRWNKRTGYSIEKIQNHIIYWEEILREIKQQELKKLNPIIHEFYEILNYRWFFYEEITFSKFEIALIKENKTDKGYKMLSNVNIPKMMSKLFSIVDNAYGKFVISKINDTQTAAYYGYTLSNTKYNIQEGWTIWFGVDFEIWSNGKSPLTIQIFSDNNEDIPKIQKLFGSEKFEYKNETEDEENVLTTYIELDKTLFEDTNENITEALVTKINEVINKI